MNRAMSISIITLLANLPQPLSAQQAGPSATPSVRCDGFKAVIGSENRCLKPMESFNECEDCPTMVVVPPGEFLMGSEDGDSDEKPVHKVTIAKPFAVGRFEVTFREWDACVSDGGCQYSPEDRGWGRGNQPVINVSWNDITTECLPWLNRRTGKHYRLLTEAEWEYSARAGTSTAYTWGNEVGRNRANCNACGSQWENKQTAPVGSFSANAFRLHDMHGNVYEWVADCYKDSYVNAPSDASAALEVPGCFRVLRGGTWMHSPAALRSASRWGNEHSAPDRRGGGGRGFRVARALD